MISTPALHCHYQIVDGRPRTELNDIVKIKNIRLCVQNAAEYDYKYNIGKALCSKHQTFSEGNNREDTQILGYSVKSKSTLKSEH